MLKDKQIAERESTIETHTKKIDLLSAESKSMRTTIAKATEKIKNLTAESEQLNIDILTAQNTDNKNRKEIAKLSDEINRIRQELETDTFDKKVLSICQKSTDFYTCLIDRIKRKQEEYKETMADYFSFIDPVSVVEKIKNQIDNNMGFDASTIHLRTVKHNYDDITKQLATMKAKGEKPDIHMAKNRLNAIDGFIESDAIIHRWYKQNEQDD